MTRPRSQLVSVEATPYYHCISRCVRRAFLCGSDHYTGKSFDHRKPWLLERLALLSDVFSIDIAAYAVMSNHYHLVLHIDSSRAKHWSDDDVIQRWTKIFRGPPLIQRYQAGIELSDIERYEVKKAVKKLRGKLTDLSKFMSCMNYYIACKANLEDGCTGRFWEGRFKSQALLDETALLSCMTYVDLNPIRAGIANNTVNSDYTSIQDRLLAAKQAGSRRKPGTKPALKPRLMIFSESLTKHQSFAVIPFNLKDYLDLVDWTGRSVRPNKKGYIRSEQPELIATLGLSETQWKRLALEIQKQSITMLNGLETLAVIEKKENKTKAA